MARTKGKFRLTCLYEPCSKYYWVHKRRSEKSKYCGIKCHSLAKQVRLLIICDNCGIEFERTPSRNAKYCSKKCGWLGHRKETECVWCGGIFWPEGSRRKYCGKKCRNASRRKTRAKCKWCGDVCKGRRSKGFCSPGCAKMHSYYQGVNLLDLQFPAMHIYPSDNAPAIWIPYTVQELEVSLYLDSLKLSSSDIVKHIKRWRRERRKYREFRKGLSIDIRPVS